MSGSAWHPNAVSGHFDFPRSVGIEQVADFVREVNKRAHELGAVTINPAFVMSPHEVDSDFRGDAGVFLTYSLPDKTSAEALFQVLEEILMESDICSDGAFGIAPITLVT